MSEIFISYARSTATEATRVADALRALGYDVWRDEDLPAHRAYADVIEERLRAATAVVVVWSAEAARSEWVQSEADMARQDHKLVQLTVDGSRRPMPFDRIQCADMTGWTGDPEAPGWRKVVASIDDLYQASSPLEPPRLGRTQHGAHGFAPRSTEPLLAVLAFDNISGDAEMAYFSDGVSEEILQTVARGAELKVVGRGSSFQFRGPDKAAAHVAAALKATHVLDGSVRRSGTKVRISANLIECEHETTLWSDRFDRELSDVFALQDEIAAAVAAALKVAFAPAAPAQSVDPAAYTLYLQAREIRNRGLLSPESVIAVVRLLQEAASLAPKFARAWEFLAAMQVEYLRFDEAKQPQGVRRADVVAAAETALKLDPSLGGAHQALGALEPFGRFAEREAFHMKALAVAPNDPTVLTNASLFLAEVGRMRDALEYARQAYALDPMYPWAASWYAVMVEYDGRVAESRALWERFTTQWPDNELIAWGAICAAYDSRDWILLDEQAAASRQKGFASAAIRSIVTLGEELRAPSPDILKGRLDRARERLARTGVLPVLEFKNLYDFGLRDEAFELVERASFAYMFDPDTGSPNGAFGSSMIFDANTNIGMMRDPRFLTLCAKLGLCDYWVQTGRWPDCADLAAPHYDFRAEARRLASSPTGAP